MTNDRPETPPEKMAEWRERAQRKGAIVPHFFEVFVNKVEIECGVCKFAFKRPLIPNLDEPVFVCPKAGCGARNWVPVRFKLS